MYPRKSQILITQLMVPNKLMLLRHSHQDTQRLAQSRLRFIILMITMIGFLLLIVRSKRSSHSMSLMASLFGNKPTILMARRLITSRLSQPWLSLETQKSKNSPIQFSQIVIRSWSKLIMARNWSYKICISIQSRNHLLLCHLICTAQGSKNHAHWLWRSHIMVSLLRLETVNMRN